MAGQKRGAVHVPAKRIWTEWLQWGVGDLATSDTMMDDANGNVGGMGIGVGIGDWGEEAFQEKESARRDGRSKHGGGAEAGGSPRTDSRRLLVVLLLCGRLLLP